MGNGLGYFNEMKDTLHRTTY